MSEISIRSEATSSDFHEPTAFNIAAAFPVTDDIVRNVEAIRRRQHLQRMINHQSLCYAAAAVVGFVAVAFAFRR